MQSLITSRRSELERVCRQWGVRRFELDDGSAQKFWEVAVEGSEVVVRYGRLGSQGQRNAKSFPDVAAARKHVDKLIEEKTGKGYTETT